MITLLLHLLRLFPFLCGSHRQLAVENLALRQQLAVYKRTTARPKLRTTDRLFWIWLARVWAGWRQPLVIVTPDTVLRWQRRRFREYWTTLQIVDAFPDDSAPSYLLRDRDQVYGQRFRHRVKGMGDRRSPQDAPQPVAKSLRGAAHRLGATRVPQPYCRSRRAASATHPDRVLRVLSPGSHASLARQG